MDFRQNLHLARVARQLGLIIGDQFDEACRICRESPETSVVDLFIERGWLQPEDIPHLQYFLERTPRHSSVRESELTAEGSVRGGSNNATVIVPRESPATIVDQRAESNGDSAQRAPSSEIKPSGRYTVQDLHAVGGMGRVWRAWDHQLHREVAIKELRPEVSKSRAIVNRFLREARLTGQLEHPGIIPVHELDADVTDRGPFYAMRLVQGRTLHQAIEDYHAKEKTGAADAMALVNLLAAFVGACNTVAYAHSHGVIHRDLKGDNIILGDFGEVVVLDWGLAKQVSVPDSTAEPDSQEFEPPEFDHADAGLTMQGQVVGTPAYMSPEQAAGRLDLIDHRTDIYGLGAILYEILTGQPPFVGSTTVEVLLAAQRGDPPAPREIAPDVPGVLEAICIRALSKDPEQRFSSAGDLALEVQQWQESERQAAEAELRASRERFELAVEGSQDGLWDWDLTTDKVWFSPRWKEIIGYADHELANDVQEWIARLHPDEKARVLEANFAHIHGTTQHYEYEYRLRHKDGSYRWILARGAALRDHTGKAYRMAGSHVDVTERRQTEQQLRRVEQFHDAVMLALPTGVVVVDHDGILQGANAAGAKLLGISLDSFPREIDQTSLARAVRDTGMPIDWRSLARNGGPTGLVVKVPQIGGTCAQARVTAHRLDHVTPEATILCFQL